MSIVNSAELSNYTASRSNAELLEDISHLIDLDIIVSATGATEIGCTQRLPFKSLFNLSRAFVVYRDEFGKRCTNEDETQETSMCLLKGYYDCVKIIRTLNKYINRFIQISDKDYSEYYLRLAENKESAQYTQNIVGG